MNSLTCDSCIDIANVGFDKETTLMISRYITVFRNTMIPVLKSDVVLQPTVYPYPNGVILVIRFSHSGMGNVFFAQSSESFEEAWQLADLPEDMMRARMSNQHSVIFAGDKIVGIKTLDSSCWSAKRASKVAQKIIETVKSIVNK